MRSSEAQGEKENTPVACLESTLGRLVGFANTTLAGEGSEADGGDGVSAVQLKSFSGRHGEDIRLIDVILVVVVVMI